MRLVMVGLDCDSAPVAAREFFSPHASELPAALAAIHGGDILGCALLVTCNRTELYISHNRDVPPDGVGPLCRALGRDERECRGFFRERHERQAAIHLMRVASGMLSGVPGDSQILTQVRTAAESAREAGVADALIETLFRSAVTAGKKVRTRADFGRECPSLATETVAAAERELGGLAGRSALVIGNGVIGRLAAAELAARGCRVRVTLRRHGGKRPAVPEGCEAVAYEDRRRAMERSDLVVSATTSPHHTVARADLEGLARLPALLVDLAVPRDIDPDVSLLDGVRLWNVDDLRRPEADAERAGLRELAEDIVREEAERFDLWRRNRSWRGGPPSGTPDFPVFINLHGASVLVAGGGRVAARRVEKLLAFGARVRVVAPELAPEMRKLASRAGFEWISGPYLARHMEGATLAIAATDRREVNRRVGRDAKERGILVSVADRREECTFYFPAIVKSEHFTAGLVSSAGDHRALRGAAARLRPEMDAIDEDYYGRKQGERPGPGADEAGGGGHSPRTAGSPGQGGGDEDLGRPDAGPEPRHRRGEGPVRQGA